MLLMFDSIYIKFVEIKHRDEDFSEHSWIGVNEQYDYKEIVQGSILGILESMVF